MSIGGIHPFNDTCKPFSERSILDYAKGVSKIEKLYHKSSIYEYQILTLYPENPMNRM
jgi:hypothetical protein